MFFSEVEPAGNAHPFTVKKLFVGRVALAIGDYTFFLLDDAIFPTIGEHTVTPRFIPSLVKEIYRKYGKKDGES